MINERNELINAWNQAKITLSKQSSSGQSNSDSIGKTDAILNNIFYSDTNMDGNITVEELNLAKKSYENQINSINFLKQNGGQQSAEYYDNQTAYYQDLLDNYNLIVDNFDAFSAKGNEGVIDNEDLEIILGIASSDGNISDITDADINVLKNSQYIKNSDADLDGTISKAEFKDFITESAELQNENQEIVEYHSNGLYNEISEEDNKLSVQEFINKVDLNDNSLIEQPEFDEFNDNIKNNINLMTQVFNNIDVDSDGKITKENFVEALKNNNGLKNDANSNLVDYIFDEIFNQISGGDNKISGIELVKHIDTSKNGSLDQEEIDKFNEGLNSDSTVVNNAKVWYGQGNGNGYIDWNRDGKFNNEKAPGQNTHYASYIAVHGDMDRFFNYFGYNWNGYHINNLDNILARDNTKKDKDSKANFVSNGIITAHKISDNKTGFNVTDRDKSKAAEVDYNYVVWDKEKGAYILGQDLNNDGNLKRQEILGIVENIGTRTSSPLVFDLNGDGVKTTGINKLYDLDGDGKLDKTAWASKNDGVLAFDANGNGISGEDGKELFGNKSDINGDGISDSISNGFEALKELAVNYLNPSALTDNILDVAEIVELEFKAGLSILVNGIKKSLTDLGITEISLNYNETNPADSKDINGNEHRQVGNGFIINGQKNAVNDVWFKYIQG